MEKYGVVSKEEVKVIEKEASDKAKKEVRKSAGFIREKEDAEKSKN